MDADCDIFVSSGTLASPRNSRQHFVLETFILISHHLTTHPLDTMSDALSLTEQLIQCASITPNDQGCQDLLASRLAAVGFQIEWMPFGDVLNFWATRGAPAPTLCFAGHTDVVPTGPLEAWATDPFIPTVRDGVLYGRGAADMKSGLAAMVTAAESFVKKHPHHKGRIAFLITSDEEGRSVDGTLRVVEALKARQETIDWCLIGEPSSEKRFGDTIKIGRRGSLSGRLRVEGIQGHIAYPHLADNPIHRFAPALTELCTHHWDNGTEHFQPTSFQIANLNAGTGAPNVIPGELNARFNLRFCPIQTVAGLQAAVSQILERHQLKYQLEWFISGLPFYSPPGALSDAAVAALTETVGTPPQLSTGGGTSDGRFIATLGTQIVELGVVNQTIHQINECVKIEEIVYLERTYERILENLLT